ncbi:hypothetical protein J7384_05765 [Endozoicomonas sp. G2_1]|uniref:hypothetical protein n=1 Tax=Endozoicomonas sp. G2_1 TaxID=2821091 RepID=UPI001ADB5223|nr:hypothetical protein [Endozoicomonas sp. G2_1]MBO9489863.1 hypothetical protein [Endozoicomonas sp. G2_1]
MNRVLSVFEQELVKEAIFQEPDLSDLEKTKYLEQSKKLCVIEECDCGDPYCYSVKYSGYEVGTSLGFADGILFRGTDKEMRVILFLNSRTGEISELETAK